MQTELNKVVAALTEFYAAPKLNAIPATAQRKQGPRGRSLCASCICGYCLVALSPDFLADFFDFFFGAILSFDIAPLLMVSPLCAAGPVVPPALSDVCADAPEATKARAVAARIIVRM